MTTDSNNNDADWTPEDETAFMAKREKQRNERLALYNSLERCLGIPNNFITELYSEADDWAYIVKLAVLCEAAVTHALVVHVGNREHEAAWYDHFSKLTNSRRLDLACKLGIISKLDREALDAVAQFRNSFAHEVRNLGGSLSEFFDRCTLDKKIELSSKLLGIKHVKDQDWSFYIANTRLLIGVGVLSPIKAIAKFGLDNDRATELEKRWKLAGLGPSPQQDG